MSSGNDDELKAIAVRKEKDIAYVSMSLIGEDEILTGQSLEATTTTLCADREDESHHEQCLLKKQKSYDLLSMNERRKKIIPSIICI